jgi:uncharacterized protein
MIRELNCQTCGACCCNPDANRSENYRYYVFIDDARSKLLTRSDWRKRYVVDDPTGAPHMRLDAAQRCVALEGKIGRRVKCAIYSNRPRGCRALEAGTEECLRARKERGIDP